MVMYVLPSTQTAILRKPQILGTAKPTEGSMKGKHRTLNYTLVITSNVIKLNYK